MKPPLIVGNWKMHGTQAEATLLARSIRRGLKNFRRVEVALAPPFTALSAVRSALRGSAVRLAGQNVHWENEGAFTGEISPRMLRELGCSFVIIGHSERRRIFGETDEAIAKKILASMGAGLRPILCIGETLSERNQGLTRRVLARQLRHGLKGLEKNAIENLEIAYEPIWAIGTGRNATPDQASKAHFWIRQTVIELFGKNRAESTRILFGGSVRPDNAVELVTAAEVNGVLVGGASLKAEDFLRIVRCCVPNRK